MAENVPTTELEPQFSSDDATATPWSEARKVLVYELAPAKAFGFGKGDSFSQTRWRF